MARNIPVHFLKEDSELEVEVVHLLPGSDRWDKLNGFEPHIDDCFTVIVVSKGCGTTEIDFRTVALSEGQLGIIAPGQVHSNIHVKECEAWMLRIAPDMMDADYRHFIDGYSMTKSAVTLEKDIIATLCDAMKLLSGLLGQAGIKRHAKGVVFNMLNVILGIVTPEIISRQQPPAHRAAEIAVSFRRMLPLYIRQQKWPSFYARRLCISEVYLNEAVKKASGLTPSAWINAAILLESKRLLRHTSLSVKEIAHEMGFDDNAYFSRLFKKKTGMTPQKFRRDILE